MQGKIRVTLVNKWGVPIRVLSLEKISITQEVTDRLLPIGSYERVTSVRQREVSNSSIRNTRNPYIVGSPINTPEKLFGREVILRNIEENLQQDAILILLHGQRRIGKSSILKNIPFFISQDEFLFVFCDLQVHGNSSLGEILSAIASNIVESLNLESSILNSLLNADSENICSIFNLIFLPLVYEVLDNKKLVLLLDEFDVVTGNEIEKGVDLLRFLDNLVRQPGKLCVIAVVSRYLDTMPSLLQLFRDSSVFKIGLLDEISAKQLITQPTEGILTYEPDAIQAILELSSGHPLFTQGICYELFNKARNEDNLKVTHQNVVNIINHAIDNAEGGLNGLYYSLSISEQVVFSVVAEAQKQNTSENPLKLLENYGVVLTNALEEAIQVLINKDFINKNPIKIKIELIRLWLVQHRPLRNQIRQLEILNAEECDPLYEVANKLRQAGRIQNALDIYKQALLINPNYFKAVLKIAELYLEEENFAKAVEFYARAFQFDPASNQEKFMQSAFSYGRQLIEQENFKLARELFAKILEIEPDNTLASEQLGRLPNSDIDSLMTPEPFVETGRLLNSDINSLRPPEPFVGRKNQIDTAFEQIANRSHLAIWGGIGMGKTYFLQYIASPQVWQEYAVDSSHAVIVRFSCEEIEPFTPSGFWKKVLSLVRDNLHAEPELQANIDIFLTDGRTSPDNLRQVLRELGQRKKFLVLLIDDYDVALVQNQEYSEENMQQFLRECRNLAVHSAEKRQISSIVTSKKRLNEFIPPFNSNQSPWYNHYLFQQMKPFNNTEIEQLLKSLHKPITRELPQVLGEITGGNPTLLKIAISLFYRQQESSNMLNIEEFVNEFESSTRQFFGHIWYSSSEVEQTLLMLMAISALKGRLHKQKQFDVTGIEFIFSQRERELIKLEEQGLVTHTVYYEKNIYSFTSSIMERWVIQELQQTDQEWLQAREKVFLNLMSRQQMDKITRAIKWIWKHQDNTP
ncbi:MAG: AAA-like domain-containing protein [Nostoc sp.]